MSRDATTRNEGEGNRTAARNYNQATEDFVKSGKVDEKARAATRMTDKERQESEAAEHAGKARAREEDPAVSKR